MERRNKIGSNRRARAGMGIVTVLTVATLLGACGSSGSGSDAADTTAAPGTTKPKAASASLAGTSWTLRTSTGPDGDEVPAAPGTEANLGFGEGGELTGSTGCNTFTGSYTVDGSALTIELGPMTEMACTDEAVQAQEVAVTTNLPEVASFTATDETLELSGKDGVLFTYAATDVSIEGEWTVTGINNGNEALVSSDAIQKLTATFADDQFSGSGGCNQLSGGYTTSGTDGIEIGPLGATMMACEGEASTVEAQYIAALESSTTYEITGSTLTLHDDDGAMQVTATRAG